MQTLVVPRVLYKSKEGLLFLLEEISLFLQQRPERKCSYTFVLHTDGKSHVLVIQRVIFQRSHRAETKYSFQNESS